VADTTEEADTAAAAPTKVKPAHTDFVRARWLLAFAALACYLIDQLTKLWAVNFLDPDQQIKVLGGLFSLRLVFNPGAAFSMGANVTVVFTVVAIAAVLGIIVFITPRVHTTTQGLSIGILLAGIAGNLTDRIIQDPAPMRGHVVDFISIPHFAIINVADIWITVAAVFIVIQLVFPRARQ
jgi:signal peptidase II